MDDEEQKQIYLRENILEKGYNAEEFIIFLTEKKGDDEVNISNWSLNEIKQLVDEFIRKQNGEYFEQNAINVNLQQNQISSSGIDNNNNNINMNKDEGLISNPMDLNNNNQYQPDIQNQIDDYNYGNSDLYGITNLDTVFCSMGDKSEFFYVESIKITLGEPEKVEGNIFSKSYITYLMTTMPFNYTVRRRYSDFEWLRINLSNIFNSSLIPPMPSKNKIGTDRFSEEFLKKRMKGLEKFMMTLLEDPLIKGSQILYDFISTEQDNKFNELKNFYAKYKKPTKAKDFKSLDGKLNIEITKEKEVDLENIKDNTSYNVELLTKLNNDMKALIGELGWVTNRMDEITKTCEQLFKISSRYYDPDNIKIAYYQLRDNFKYWSDSLKKLTNLLDDETREYFKFVKNSYLSMKELVANVENYKNNFYKTKKLLIAKKEDLFKKSDISKWDLPPGDTADIVSLLKDKKATLPKMLCKETSNVINLKQMYGHYLNKILGEYDRLKQTDNIYHRENIGKECKTQIGIISELFKNISEISLCTENKYGIKVLEQRFAENYAKELVIPGQSFEQPHPPSQNEGNNIMNENNNEEESNENKIDNDSKENL